MSTSRIRMNVMNVGEYTTIHPETDGSVVEIETVDADTILNTTELSLGQIVYFKAYPSISWQVQHIDGDYTYLALGEMTDVTKFGNDVNYSGSTIAQKCANYLSITIPDLVRYLENVTVNGVTGESVYPHEGDV